MLHTFYCTDITAKNTETGALVLVLHDGPDEIAMLTIRGHADGDGVVRIEAQAEKIVEALK